MALKAKPTKNFFIGFLAELDNSKAFGKKKFFGLFWPYEGQKKIFFLRRDAKCNDAKHLDAKPWDANRHDAKHRDAKFRDVMCRDASKHSDAKTQSVGMHTGITVYGSCFGGDLRLTLAFEVITYGT